MTQECEQMQLFIISKTFDKNKDSWVNYTNLIGVTNFMLHFKYLL